VESLSAAMSRSVDDVRTAADMVAFLTEMYEEMERRPEEFGKFTAARFIEAASAWLDDGGGERWHSRQPDDGSDPWRMVAMAFWAGANYD
jgi:hypothetical protein